MQINDLKKNIIELLEKDKEFRYTVAGLIGYKELLDRIIKIDERVVNVEERLAGHDNKFNAIIEEIRDIKKVQVEHSKRLEE